MESFNIFEYLLNLLLTFISPLIFLYPLTIQDLEIFCSTFKVPRQLLQRARRKMKTLYLSQDRDYSASSIAAHNWKLGLKDNHCQVQILSLCQDILVLEPSCVHLLFRFGCPAKNRGEPATTTCDNWVPVDVTRLPNLVSPPLDSHGHKVLIQSSAHIPLLNDRSINVQKQWTRISSKTEISLQIGFKS